MEESAFERLRQPLALIGSRRRLLGQLGALPPASLLARVGDEETAANRPCHGRRGGLWPGAGSSRPKRPAIIALKTRSKRWIVLGDS
jgi:hypothetical protein